MAGFVTHSTAADGTFSAAGSSAWGADHTITGAIPAANFPALTGAVTTVAGALATSVGTIPGRLLKLTILTSGSAATHTLQAATTQAFIHIKAGGGQGGCGGTTSGNAACCGGGAEGGEAWKLYTGLTGGGSLTYTVGAGGSGAAFSGASGATGTAGSDSTITDGVTIVTAKGGPGGLGQNAGSATAFVMGAAAPAVSTNGDLNGSGDCGQMALRFSGTLGASGAGGGKGGGVAVAAAAGTNAVTNSGGGGSGAGVVNNVPAGGNGGTGGAGYIEIWEFA